MYPRVLRLPKNVTGRDFVIGDIHGAYDLVWQGMKAVNFNPEVDRLLSVGDLIDRGAGSARCLKFLQQPFVFAIAGNHERMLVNAWHEGNFDKAVMDALATMNYNGMRWLKGVTKETLTEIVAALDKLPFVIEVDAHRGSVGLVHADVPKGMDWHAFTAGIENGDAYCTRMALGLDISGHFHESRQRVETERTDGVPGVGRVFVGHTVLFNGMKRFGNVYAVDTGAVFGDSGKGKGHLTLVNPLMATTYLTTPVDRPNPLLDLRVAGDVPDREFSSLVEQSGEDFPALK